MSSAEHIQEVKKNSKAGLYIEFTAAEEGNVNNQRRNISE